MDITGQLTDTAILRELGARLAATRLGRNLTQAALAEQAGVSKRTLERLESGEVATQLAGFVRVCRALGLIERLDLLVPEPVPSPLAQLKLQGRQRRRASGERAKGTRGAADGPGTWTWGEPE